MRRKRIEVGAPFLIAEPGPRHNETVGPPRYCLENGEIFPRLFRDGDGKTGDLFLLQEMPQQLAQRPAHGVDRAYVGAEALRHPGHIDAAASRVAPRGLHRILWNGTNRSTEVEASIAGLMVRVTMSTICAGLDQDSVRTTASSPAMSHTHAP